MGYRKTSPEYGNWVPINFIYALSGASGFFLVLVILNIVWWKKPLLSVILSFFFLLMSGYTLYMLSCRKEFSFEGGGLMRKIHRLLLSKLPWDQKGKVLDIGCGSGALSILCAKEFPRVSVTGMDYWGIEWSYGKEQCEKNASSEEIKGIEFVQGDAASLPFETETFDAVISNFVFHEVRTEPDKRKLVKEALRILKKGGSFAFNDMFAFKRMYGNMEDFIKELKEEGIEEIHYEANLEKLDFIPKFTATPLMLKGMGILYGRK